MATIPLLLPLSFAVLLAQIPTAPGTETNQNILFVAISALASVTIYLHRSNQVAAAKKDLADTTRFNSFVKHHEELIHKIDEERNSMTSERLNRISMLVDMVSANAVANEKQAAALNHLSQIIAERITPTKPSS